MKHLTRFTFVLAAVLIPLSAAADVVRPPPTDCPPGHTPRTSHMGPYCEPPPPAECPPGHVPSVYMSEAYCEPPPAEACPVGSRWVSRSATDVHCQGGWKCEAGSCPEGQTCRESSLCVTLIHPPWRGPSLEKVSGVCEGEAGCPEGESCVKAMRCDPDVKREPAPAPATEDGASSDETAEPAPETAPEVTPADDADDVPKSGTCAVAGGPVSWPVGILLGACLLYRRSVGRG